jgi:hypothetical protein
LIAVLVVALVAAACGSSGPSSVATTLETPVASTAPGTPSAPGATGSHEPVATPALSAVPSVGPQATASPEPTGEASGTPDPGTTPGASATPGDLAACTGTDANRAFLSDTAAAFPWEVYCASLPAGWFVDSGRYRGASGGWMEIFYRTSSGLRFELREGNFCTGTPAECGPLDTSLGAGSFGDLTGDAGTDAGNFVIYVGPGTLPAYQATGIGLDEATFRAFAAALIKVPG